MSRLQESLITWPYATAQKTARFTRSTICIESTKNDEACFIEGLEVVQRLPYVCPRVAILAINLWGTEVC